MRKIESLMCQAISNGAKSWKSGNTKVVTNTEGYSHVYLHGNHIATVAQNSVTIYDGGWQSNTTKSRLNAILSVFGMQRQCDTYCSPEGVFQKAYQWYVRVIQNGELVTVPFVNGFKFA